MFIKWIITSIALLGIFSTLQATHSGVKGNRADYIIVGVGTAGGLLAKKLTDDKKTSVIALHSGKNFTDSFILKYGKNTLFSVASTLLGSPPPFNPASLDLPPEVQQQLQDLINLSTTTAKPLYETGMTIPQPNANDEELLWVISLPEGGGSGVNAGAWCRGTNQVYSQWETLAGPNWSVSRIIDTYKELEHYVGTATNVNARGYRGPLKVLQQTPASPLANVFTQAVLDGTGVPLVIDYNDPATPIGVSPTLQLTRRGDDGYYRISSATAFLDNDVMKKNGKGVNGRKLKVQFESTALRVIWEGTTAVGVEYIHNGITQQVYANKGVIVCAGLRSSPFLLNSGVGPSALLTSLGIPVVFDNPNVGQGLADQPHVILFFASNPNDSSVGSNSVFSQISWLPDPNGVLPGRQLRLATVDVIPGVTPALFDLCQPLSRGSVTINSSNPLDPPVIDFGVLSNPSDLNLFVAGFQTYIKNINIQLQAIDPQYELIYPDPSLLEPGETPLLEEFIRDNIEANMHFQSHCRMAPLDQGGVVDSNGRVYGVNNLIVADNSIVPQCMDGSPMASAYLIAANIAALLGY